MASSRWHGNDWRLPLVSVILIAGLWLGGCQRFTELQTMIAVTLDRPQEATATVTEQDGRALIDVTDPRGINGLTARLTQGEWPTEIVIRLPLRGLEQLTIQYGDLMIATGVSSSGAPAALTISTVDEAGNVQSASPSADIYYPDIRAVTPNGTTAVGPLAAGERPPFPLPEGSAIEIVMPSHFYMEQQPMFSLKWIDFYRN